MRLSISNIAWPQEWDDEIYSEMKALGYEGLEIAPTRIIPENPYDKLNEIFSWYKSIKELFAVSSMQSIWFGMTENIFNNESERQTLINYTKKAINFAESIKCNNLVFGCPRNRNNSELKPEEIAVDFFREIGNYAYSHNTVIGIEANPPIYNTNFLNGTDETIQFVKRVNSSGIRLNLDIGTMIQNGETPDVLKGNMHLVNHIHISEPGLVKIFQRDIHRQLFLLTQDYGYKGYVSIEMGKQKSVEDICEVMKCVKDLWGD